MARLPALIARAQATLGWAARLAGVASADIASRATLARLPVTRKADLMALQHNALPFGGLASTDVAHLRRIFMSPGPIFDPEARSQDWWRSAHALNALGLRRGDMIQNCFSYHFTPAAFMIEGGAEKIGCPVIPAGIGQTEMQVQAMVALKPAAYAGTPSFLKIIIEKAQAMNADISSLNKALVSAEALPPSLRSWFHEHGVPHVLQFYGTADIGTIAYETMTDGQCHPGMVLAEQLLLEIVRPGSGEPVVHGEVGEVVITSFNPDYPLVRFATGDLSAVIAGDSPCGRTNTRLRGWMGRADQSTKVRGQFVHPAHVAELRQRHPLILKARLVISGVMADDAMQLQCEVAEVAGVAAAADQAGAIAESIRAVTKLRGDVLFVAVGSLANDGLVIDDTRSYA
ncbi:MAG: phenylacetate-CoA ligase [Burkholderiaceae bacterium]|jgi:phenylacetate-CoA ligase